MPPKGSRSRTVRDPVVPPASVVDTSVPAPAATLKEEEAAAVPEYEMTPLNRSLVYASTSPNSITSAHFANVPTSNNPRTIKNYIDTAAYFVGKDGLPFVFRFPAVVKKGTFGKMSSYFNLSTYNEFQLSDLKKARVQLELAMLPSDEGFPDTAVECSGTMFDSLVILFNETEATRNFRVPEDKKPAVTPFWRTYQDTNEDWRMLLTSPVIFGNMGTADKRIAIPTMGRADIGKDRKRMSPSKALVASGAPAGPPVNSMNESAYSINDLPDPLGKYAELYSRADIDNVKMFLPEIRDGHGVLIDVVDYEEKLADGTVVMVDAILKLWAMPAMNRPGASSNYRRRDGEENGSRTYQMMLQSVVVLPSTTAVVASMVDGIKRRGTDESEAEGSPRKRAKTSTALVDTDDDASAGDASGSSAALFIDDEAEEDDEEQ